MTIKYVVGNSKEEKEKQHTINLIDKSVPYKEMTEKEIESVILYHAKQLADKIIASKKEQERQKETKEFYENNKRIANESLSIFKDMCKSIGNNNE